MLSQARRNDLPTQAELVLEPSALRSRCRLGRELRPVVSRSRPASRSERQMKSHRVNGWAGPPLSAVKVQPVEFERDGEHRSLRPARRVGGAPELAYLARVGEDSRSRNRRPLRHSIRTRERRNPRGIFKWLISSPGWHWIVPTGGATADFHCIIHRLQDASEFRRMPLWAGLSRQSHLPRRSFPVSNIKLEIKIPIPRKENRSDEGKHIFEFPRQLPGSHEFYEKHLGAKILMKSTFAEMAVGRSAEYASRVWTEWHSARPHSRSATPC